MFQKFVMPVIRQITLVRFAGLAAMSLMFVLFNLKFSFIMNFHDTVECIKGTANGVLFPLEPHPYDLSSLEKAVINFGQASAALYGAVLALGLSVFLHRRMRHLGWQRYLFTAVLFAAASAAIIAVSISITSNDLYFIVRDVLVPPVVMTLFRYITVLLWKATKPQTAHGPNADHDAASASEFSTDALTAERTDDSGAKNGGGLHVLELRPYRSA